MTQRDGKGPRKFELNSSGTRDRHVRSPNPKLNIGSQRIAPQILTNGPAVSFPSVQWKTTINGPRFPSIRCLRNFRARCVRFSLKRSEPNRNRSDRGAIRAASARSMNRLATRFRSSCLFREFYAASSIYRRGGSRLKWQSKREHRPIASGNLKVRTLQKANENALYARLTSL